MILATTPGTRKSIAEESPTFPAALTDLPRWCVYRSRTKKYKDRDRPVYEALHPATGHELPVSKPDAWVTFTEACNPGGRKPYDGVGFLVRVEDGLAVIRRATHAQADRLADACVYVTQEVGGDGLVLIVRSVVCGAKSDCFVPLSGRSPYQSRDQVPLEGFPDGVRTDSGQDPYQGDAFSGQEPYQENRVSPDGARILLSSFPPEIITEVEKKTVADDLAELAEEVLEQGMSRGTDDDWKWLYSVISTLQIHGLKADEVTPQLLLKTAETLGVDANDLQARVVARWSKLDPSRGLLADALRAVRADASLLKDLPLANPNALFIAGMARYMGREGKPFRLHQVSLAQVLGLPGQQAVSPLVISLREMGYLKRVVEHKYAGPKAGRLAAEYVWTGPGAVEPQPAVGVVPAVPVRVPVPHPPPQFRPSPPPSPRRDGNELRPGHSTEQDNDHRWQSRFGGFLSLDYYLAEQMVACRLKRDGEDLYETFWLKDRLGGENLSQAKTARELLKKYPKEAILAALKTPEGKRAYSLRGEWMDSLIKKQVPVVLHKQAEFDKRVQQAAESPRPAPVQFQSPRPPFCPNGKSLLRKLSKVST